MARSSKSLHEALPLDTVYYLENGKCKGEAPTGSWKYFGPGELVGWDRYAELSELDPRP